MQTIKDAVATWLDDDIYTATINRGTEIYMRARATLAELISLRTLRDSRKKHDHLKKYTAAYDMETGGDWQRDMFTPLVDKISEIFFAGLAAPTEESEKTQPAKKRKGR
jgi:hypothetical protein